MPAAPSSFTPSLFQTTGIPAIMGVVNVTPDSFSDGGHFFAPDEAVAHAVQLVGEGADLLDIGGESTRPGSDPVSAEEERRRVVPVIQALRDRFPDLPLSIDTSKASVAQAALRAGADIVNDVLAGQGDLEMLSVVADHGCGYIMMHMQGKPKTMQEEPVYEDVVGDVCMFFEKRIQTALEAGIPGTHLALDPGIGFGKLLEHNLELMRELPRLKELGLPLLLGVSRKRWIGELTGREVEHRLAGSLAGAIACMVRGATMIRVHDVAETRDALSVAHAILGGEHGKG